MPRSAPIRRSVALLLALAEEEEKLPYSCLGRLRSPVPNPVPAAGSKSLEARQYVVALAQAREPPSKRRMLKIQLRNIRGVGKTGNVACDERSDGKKGKK